MDTATRPYRTNRDGFPVIGCDRCGGMGRIPAFGNIHSGVCFKCAGSGWVWASRQVAALAGQFYDAVKAARSCMLAVLLTVAEDGTRTYNQSIAVGDEVRLYKDEPWRKVVAVRRTAKLWGWGYSGRELHFTIGTRVTFADGETIDGTNITWKRKADTDRLAALRDDLAAKARTGYEASIARDECKRRGEHSRKRDHRCLTDEQARSAGAAA